MRYSIEGEPLPVVICELEGGEKLTCESGAMAWMSPNMKMETSGGGVGKILGRAFSGETLFLNHYSAEGGPGFIAFASNVPGSIRAFQISPGHDIVAQKNAFLACEAGVDLSVFFQKKAGAGFFGGEGFIMQKLSGQGMAFVEFDGYVKEYDLQPGQSIIVDTGYLAAMDATCSIDIKTVPGIKNALFGGEGIFNTVITGPGHVWIHSMPVPQLAGALAPFLPTSK
ncbi:MAG: TIGR00266 family protein [Lachnospiraceae bacterium]|nr:TIGR00266 family protein [Lachnospiraceae bacterium]